MTEENNKNHQKKLVVFLCTFMGLAILLTILAVLNEKNLSTVIGVYFLYGGMIAIFIGFMFLRRGKSRADGSSQSNYVKNNEYFKQVRREEKPFEQIVLAVILAGFLIAMVGYFLFSFW